MYFNELLNLHLGIIDKGISAKDSIDSYLVTAFEKCDLLNDVICLRNKYEFT
jgi:hypothetical protein